MRSIRAAGPRPLAAVLALAAAAALAAQGACTGSPAPDGGRDAGPGIPDGGTVEGCTPANCDLMVSLYRTTFLFDADVNGCLWRVGNTDGEPVGWDPEVACPDYCSALGAGGVLACLADHAAQCRAGGGGAAGVTACAKIAGDCQRTHPTTRVALACEQACTKARMRCEAACSQTDFMACWSCSVACVHAQSDCRRACPPATARCADGVRDGDESDVDCGGDCGPCTGANTCQQDPDCAFAGCADGRCADVPGCGGSADCEADRHCFNGQYCYPE